MEQILRQFTSGNLYDASNKLLSQLHVLHTQEEPTPMHYEDYFDGEIRRNRQTLWGVCKSLTQRHVAKRYMIAEKFLPLHHESYQQYKYV